jgi:hypothetical protein
MSRELFLRGLGLIYLIAFVSLWVQVDGLAGSSGLAPAEKLIEVVESAHAQRPEASHPFPPVSG